MSIVDYTEIMSAEGRNGMMKQVGVEILPTFNGISLFPMNTRGIGRAMIQIPIDDLDAFIEELNNIKEIYHG
jgi:hypothetical protein